MNIINLSDFDKNWYWLRDEFDQSTDSWYHFSSLTVNLPSMLPKKESLARVITAFNTVKLAKKKPSVIISHLPRPAMYLGHLANIFCHDTPHLVYAFNFTNLPQGAQKKFMTSAFKHPTKFVTFSSVERELYADHFDLDIDKIDMLHWAVHAPKIDLYTPPVVAGRYICALGSQGRDYATLFKAMKRIPHVKLVLVATAQSLSGLNIPSNVIVYSDVALSVAHNILAHSAFMVLPLRDNKVPCGHVTIVSAMFFKKAIIATNSLGVHDYIIDNETGLFFEPNNPDDLADQIELLWEEATGLNKPLLASLSEAGYAFANLHCTEKTAVNYFEGFLKTYSS